MGLIKLLFNMDDYFDAIELVRKGNRFNIDLKVADIYEIEDTRIDNITQDVADRVRFSYYYGFDSIPTNIGNVNKTDEFKDDWGEYYKACESYNKNESCTNAFNSYVTISGAGSFTGGLRNTDEASYG